MSAQGQQRTWQYVPLRQQPGIDVESTPLANSAGWSYGAAVRFRDGHPEKVGGFQALNSISPLTGICTGMHSWSDLNQNSYIACGTDQMLELFFGGLLVDITPIRYTSDNTPQFTTQIGITTVNVKDVAHGALTGDWVDIVIPVSVGGIVIQGNFQVTTVDADNYTIIVPGAPTAAIVNGGAVPLFSSVNTSGDITVHLNNGNYVVGNTFSVQVSTTIATIVIAVGTYTVTTRINANQFIIQPGGVANATTNVSENGGNARLAYYIHSGAPTASLTITSGGYGVGPYGLGPYGVSSGGFVLTPVRQWFLDNFGQDLVGNCTDSPVLLWQPPVSETNRAVAIDTTNFPGAIDPPLRCNFSFVATPQRMIIVGGSNTPGTSDYDPNLVRWCDQDDFLDWAATSLNQAGSYRIPTGSRLVGGLPSPNFIVLWTDIDMWLMNYLGGSGLSALTWGFAKVAGGVGLLSARACAVFRNLVFFASSNGIYVFNGNSLTMLPCTVWDKFWKNLDRTQVDKVNMQVNSYFQELSIAFPTMTANDDQVVNAKITFNIRDNTWTYDDPPTVLARTAWEDENGYGSPIGTDLAGYIQQQDSEGVYDANGSALPASIQTGWFSISEGSMVAMLERVETDLYVTGGTLAVSITVYTQDYPTGPVRTFGPFPWVFGTGPPFAIVRARGRFASIKIESTALGVWWRLGDLRYRVTESGRRP